jgi:hypothetical protein
LETIAGLAYPILSPTNKGGRNMKTIYLLIVAFAMQMTALKANEGDTFILRRDLAQYKGSDYSNVVRVERGITLEKAFEIANSDPEIDYFVYLKGGQMVLEIPANVPFDPKSDPFGLVRKIDFRYDFGNRGHGYCRVFSHGDTVFFKNEGMWLGSAPGLADTYLKGVSILPIKE